MQKYIESLGWKKIAIILIVLSVVFLIVIVVSTSGTAKKIQESQETTPSGQPNSAGLGKNGAPLPTTGLRTRVIPSTPYTYTTKPYKGDGYKLDYPFNWEAEKLNKTLVHFAQKTTLLGVETYPRVTVDVAPISESSPTVQQLVNSLSPLGLSSEVFNFHDVNAMRLSGVLPFEFKTEDGSIKKVNKTFIFLTHKSLLYKITYGYYLDGQEEYYAAIIKGIMDSFTFQ